MIDSDINEVQDVINTTDAKIYADSKLSQNEQSLNLEFCYRSKILISDIIQICLLQHGKVCKIFRTVGC